MPAIIEACVESALAAVDPRSSVLRHFSHDEARVRGRGTDFVFDRQKGGRRVWIVGAGKASEAMARACVELFGPAVCGGLVITKHPRVEQVGPVRIVAGDHPIPGPKTRQAVAELSELVERIGPDDLVVCAISGGASSLLSRPRVPWSTWQRMHELVLSLPIPIVEFNGLRGALDELKAGGLAKMIARSELVTCIVSDVVGDPLAHIGGGPTIAHRSDPQPALQSLRRLGHAEMASELEQGLAGLKQPTADPDGAGQGPRHQLLVASNGHARRAALDTATRLGLAVGDHGSELSGIADEVAPGLINRARHEAQSSPTQKPRLDIWGGETTVRVRAAGVGGRNQHLAVAAMSAMRQFPCALCITLATDGDDGPTRAAGGVIDATSWARACELGRAPESAIAENDSHTLLKAMGDVIVTGPTGTNVCDLVMVFSGLT